MCRVTTVDVLSLVTSSSCMQIKCVTTAGKSNCATVEYHIFNNACEICAATDYGDAKPMQNDVSECFPVCRRVVSEVTAKWRQLNQS